MEGFNAGSPQKDRLAYKRYGIFTLMYQILVIDTEKDRKRLVVEYEHAEGVEWFVNKGLMEPEDWKGDFVPWTLEPVEAPEKEGPKIILPPER